MDPWSILEEARKKDIQIIGIADHNSTLQGRLMKEEFPTGKVMILTGAEVTTREEIHCLAFFDDVAALDEFQSYLDYHLPPIPNNPVYFGDQVVVNATGRIVYEEKRLLISALDQSLEQVGSFVSGFGGMFIPAHINRSSFSLLSQLGMIPANLRADAIEWIPGCKGGVPLRKDPDQPSYPVVFSSDAHSPDAIGSRYTEMEIREWTFKGIRNALRRISNRI